MPQDKKLPLVTYLHKDSDMDDEELIEMVTAFEDSRCWQGTSMERVEYLMVFACNGMQLYEHLLGIVYLGLARQVRVVEERACSLLCRATRIGVRFVLESDERGVLARHLRSAGVELPASSVDPYS